MDERMDYNEMEQEAANELVATEEKKELETTPPKTPLQLLAERKMQELQELNPGFKLDFLNVFTRIKMNTKGQFIYELGGEEFKLGDEIITRLLCGEYMYQLWDSDENNLVCYSTDHVSNVDGEPCSQCPHNDGQGIHPDCRIRYAMVLNLFMEGEDPDETYNINIPSTGTYAFADYAKLLKKLKKGVTDVKTKIFTEERTGKNDSSVKYNAILFKRVAE